MKQYTLTTLKEGKELLDKNGQQFNCLFNINTKQFTLKEYIELKILYSNWRAKEENKLAHQLFQTPYDSLKKEQKRSVVRQLKIIRFNLE